MPTLYVENIPEDLYEALREQARAHRRSMAQELIVLLDRQVPTRRELERRRRFLKKALQRTAQSPLKPGPFPSTEEILRDDRNR